MKVLRGFSSGLNTRIVLLSVILSLFFVFYSICQEVRPCIPGGQRREGAISRGHG